MGLHSRASIKNADALYVYKRQTYLRCGGTIAAAAVGGRSLYWCPRCQSSDARADPKTLEKELE